MAAARLMPLNVVLPNTFFKPRTQAPAIALRNAWCSGAQLSGAIVHASLAPQLPPAAAAGASLPSSSPADNNNGSMPANEGGRPTRNNEWNMLMEIWKKGWQLASNFFENPEHYFALMSNYVATTIALSKQFSRPTLKTVLLQTAVVLVVLTMFCMVASGLDAACAALPKIQLSAETSNLFLKKGVAVLKYLR